MEIREIKENELIQLCALYTQLHGNKMPDDNEQLRALWTKIINDDDQHIVVAIEDGKIVSSCILIVIPNLTHDQRPYSVVENVITDEYYRNKGYAGAVLDYAKELAIKHNCYKIMLSTGSKLQSTLHFYESKGYNKNDKTAFIQWLCND